MSQLSPSDEALVAHIQRAYESRRRRGLWFLLAAIAVLAGTVWVWFRLADAQTAAKNFLAVQSNAPTGADSLEALLDWALFFVGFKLGVSFTVLGIGLAHLLAHAVSLIWFQDKERLLLELNRRLEEANSARGG